MTADDSGEQSWNAVFASGDSTHLQRINLDASRSNSIYGNSATVQPKSVTVKFCIKY